jgi:hypothetical protein
MTRIIGATGHRTAILGYSKEVANRVILLVRKYLEEAQPDEVYAGGVIGYDTFLL